MDNTVTIQLTKYVINDVRGESIAGYRYIFHHCFVSLFSRYIPNILQSLLIQTCHLSLFTVLIYH